MILHADKGAPHAVHPARLVTCNAGVSQTFLYTTYQDYWAGELVNLDNLAKARYLDSHVRTCNEHLVQQWTVCDEGDWLAVRFGP